MPRHVKPPMEKPFWKSKTVWINALMLVSEITLIFTDTLSLSPETVSIMLVINKIVNVALRVISDQRLTLK